MSHRTPPRFVMRTLVATLATVASVLSAVLLVVTLNVQTSVRAGVVERLKTGSDLLAALEKQRAQQLRAQVATLAENSTLKAAVDTYHAELRTTDQAGRRYLLATIERELDKLADRIQPDVLEVRSASGEVLGVAGRRASEWPVYARANAARHDTDSTLVTAPSGIFRLASVPVVLQGTELGTLSLASALDDRYATEISDLSKARTLILSNYHVVASTLPSDAVMGLNAEIVKKLASQEVVDLGGSEYAVRPLLPEGAAQVYVLDSIDASARPLIAKALRAMGGLRSVRSRWRRSRASGCRARSPVPSTRCRRLSPA